MFKKNKRSTNCSIKDEKRFTDGKHSNKKQDSRCKKSRNNSKQGLMKEWL